MIKLPDDFYNPSKTIIFRQLKSGYNQFLAKIVVLTVLCLSAIPFSSSTEARDKVVPNPKMAAQNLYKAWRTKNRKAALKVASKDAVNKLLSVRWRVMTFKGCKNMEEGGFECIYRDAKNDFDLAMIVEGGVSVGGYHVESLSFSTEAI